MKTSKSRPKKTSRLLKKFSKSEKKSKKKASPRNLVHRNSAKADRTERLPEMVNRLNSRGKKIGLVEKHEAHLKGFMHPVAHVWVIDDQKRMIFQFRSRSMRGYPHHWDSAVGGHIDPNETPHIGAAREAREELGVRSRLTFIGHADYSHREKNKTGNYHHHERVYFYYTTLKKGAKIKPNEEFEDIAFVPLLDVPAFVRKNKFTHSFLCGWKKYGSRIVNKAKHADF